MSRDNCACTYRYNRQNRRNDFKILSKKGLQNGILFYGSLHMLCDPVIGYGRPASVSVMLLPPDPDPLVEAPVKVFGRLELVVTVCNKCRAISVHSQYLSQGILIFRDRTPTRGTAEIPLIIPVAVKGKGPHACMEGSSHGKSGKRLRIGSGEAYRLSGKVVQMGCNDPVIPIGPYMVLS